jgi:hypothetical protein
VRVLGGASALHLNGTRHGMLHVLGVRLRRTEDGERGIAEEVDDEPPMPRDNPHQEPEVVVEDGDDLFGAEALGEACETAQVGKGVCSGYV